MRLHLATVSAVALTLAIGSPAAAQDQTAPQPGTETAPGATPMPGVGTDDAMEGEGPDVATDPATGTVGTGGPDTDLATDPAADPGADAFAQDRIGIEELEHAMDGLGVDDRGLFAGAILTGETEDGDRVALLVGPEDFAREEGDAGIVELGDLQGALGDAGFSDMTQTLDWLVMQGELDGHTILAMASDPGIHAAGDIAAEGAPGEIDESGLRDKLAEAGIDAEDEVDARLFRASAEGGGTIFFLVGPEGFAPGESVELSADELREKFEEAGLSGVEEVEDGVHIVRGSKEDHAVLAVAGDALHRGVPQN